jgi:predicted DNA-binding transcriptional regulator AlpA
MPKTKPLIRETPSSSPAQGPVPAPGIILSNYTLEQIGEYFLQLLAEKGLPVQNKAQEEAEIVDMMELCSRLKISKQTLIRWSKKSKIPTIRIGGNVRYNFPEVLNALSQSKSNL